MVDQKIGPCSRATRRFLPQHSATAIPRLRLGAATGSARQVYGSPENKKAPRSEARGHDGDDDEGAQKTKAALRLPRLLDQTRMPEDSFLLSLIACGVNHVTSDSLTH